MSISFNAKVTVPEDVLVSQLDGESVLLHLGSESYFGLGEVGTRMWEALTTSNSIEQTYQTLLPEYDVDHDTLRRDLMELVDQLVGRGLLSIANE